MAMVNLGDICRTYIGQQCQYGARYAAAGPGKSYEGEYPDVLSAQYGDGRVLISVTGHVGDYHRMKIDSGEALEFAARVVTYQHECGQISDERYTDRMAQIAADQDVDLVEKFTW